MEFSKYFESNEQNDAASERTKKELLDLVMTKANEVENSLPYPKVARMFNEDRLRGICLSDWSPEGRYYDPPVIADITFYEKNLDGFDVRTCYEFLEGSDGLNLAKYVEMNPTRSEEIKQAERAAMKLLNEAVEKKGGFDINRLRAFFDAAIKSTKKSDGLKKRRAKKKSS